jgi:mono/diheme cytochrome c family protein
MPNVHKYFGLLACIFSIPFSQCSNTDQSHDSTQKSTDDIGAVIFEKHCKLCHGIDGKLGLNGAKDLTQSKLSVPERVELVRNGKNLMTPFAGILSKSEIEAVANFTLKFASNQ